MLVTDRGKKGAESSRLSTVKEARKGTHMCRVDEVSREQVRYGREAKREREGERETRCLVLATALGALLTS